MGSDGTDEALLHLSPVFLLSFSSSFILSRQLLPDTPKMSELRKIEKSLDTAATAEERNHLAKEILAELSTQWKLRDDNIEIKVFSEGITNTVSYLFLYVQESALISFVSDVEGEESRIRHSFRRERKERCRSKGLRRRRCSR